MITIYDAELDIAEAIKNNAIAMNLTTEVVNVESEFFTKGNANPFQIDLFYLKSILVSVGWNQNDDVFDRAEIIAARHTPVDKQFNFMHNEKDIIGHITSTKIFADSRYFEDDELDQLPSKFDIVVGSVIYKSWQDEKLKARIEKLIAEIKENKWFISMECLFRDFDYALETPEGSKVVARNAETAFLTKYLRSYGGSGEFKGNKIGRLLRNFTFSGKGLVDDPANKRSVILDYSDVSEETASAREMKMSDKTYTQDEYNAVVAKLDELQNSAKTQEMDNLRKEVATQKDEIAKVKNELSVALEVAKNKDEQISKLTQAKTDLEGQLATQAEAIKKIEIEKVKASRLAKLAAKDITSERAVALVEKFIAVADEMFNEVVDSLPAKVEKQEKKTQATVILDEYELDNEPALSVASTDSDKKDADELRSKASAWVKSAFNNKGE